MDQRYLIVLAAGIGVSPMAFGKLVFPVKSHDFGLIQRGETPYFDFRFTNKGPGRFRIEGVDATCGCIGVEHAPGKSYGPGEEGHLRVHFSSTDFNGKFAQDVLVWAGEGKPIRLALSAQIRSSITLNPPLVDFADVSVDSPRTVTLNLERPLNSEIKLVNLENNLSFLSDASLVGDSQLRLTLKDDLISGKYFGVVSVYTNDRYLKKFKVPVIASVETDLKVIPEYLEFGSIAREASRNKFLAITSDRFDRLELKSSELIVNGEIINHNLAKIVKEKSGFSVTITNHSAQAGAFSGVLNLMRDNLLMAEVKYFGFFR